MPIITAVHGDITRQEVAAVVNAAANAMRGGGGVDGAIHRRGGPAVLRDCIARFPNGLATGDAGWTTAGDLPAQWVIHTVGPNYRAGQRDRSLLESCYRRALEVADELGARSVAFPLISAGIYGWPRADAIAAAVETIAAAETSVGEARIVAFDEATYRQVRAAVLRCCPPPVGDGTVGALFETEPGQYGQRGDTYLWRELRARFAGTPLPDDGSALRSLLTAAIEDVIGRPLTSGGAARRDDSGAARPDDDTSAVYLPEFDPGHGMSAGRVHLPWWVDTALPLLLDRHAALKGADAPGER